MKLVNCPCDHCGCDTLHIGRECSVCGEPVPAMRDLDSKEGRQPASRSQRVAQATYSAFVSLRDVLTLYGITAVTRRSWEHAGRLPARDVVINGKAVGWRRETLDRAAPQKRQGGPRRGAGRRPRNPELQAAA